MRVAICDDMDIFLKKLRKQINIYCCDNELQIDEFSSGEELLDHFEIDKYDAIILDVEMKKINGLQTAHEIHRIDKGVVIAFHTSYNSLHTAEYDIGSYELMGKSQSDDVYQGQLQKIFEECKVRNTMFHFSAGDMPLKKIKYFKKRWRKIAMYTVDGIYEISGKFDPLDLPKFEKIHRRYYVNPMFIDRFNFNKVIINGGMELPFNRNTRA